MVNETSRETNQTTAAGLLKMNMMAIAQLVPIASIIIVVNMLVLVVFCKTKKLRTPANYILFSLAVNDLMTGALHIPLFITVFFTPIITSGTMRFYLGFLLTVVHTLTAIVSVYHIVIATLEKYLAIIKPVTHRLVKKTTVIKILLMVWFLSVIIGLIPFAWINKSHHPEAAKYFIGYVIFCFAAVFLLPYSFMMYAFVKIFKAISRGAGQCGTNETRERHKKKLARERKSIILFVTMATAFSICWFPWFLLSLLFSLNFEPEALEIPAHVFALVRYITSVINPLLYSLFRPDFYTAMKTLMKRTGRSVVVNCGSFHQRRVKRQKMHVCHVEHVYCTVSEQLQALSSEPEQITGN